MARRGDLAMTTVIMAIGGSAVQGLAQCTPQWLPQPPRAQLNGYVSELAATSSGLFAGGDFTMASGQPANHIARWNGAGWSTLGAGVDDIVYAIREYDGAIIAGGAFANAGGQPIANIARWDGASWSALGAGPPGPGWTHALAEHAGHLIAGRDFQCASWDGAQWTVLGTMNNLVVALAVHDGALVAGGGFFQAGGQPVSNVARWLGGTAWASYGLLGTPMESHVSALGVHNGQLHAAGVWFGGFVVRWNGTAWQSLGQPPWWPGALTWFRGDLIAGGGPGTGVYRGPGPPGSLWGRARTTPRSPSSTTRALSG